jgi:tRNA pseudouridine38-40 synthase
MPRYFIEVSYCGTNFSGFQIQQNANTIQAEVEKALKIYFKQAIQLTGSSRTDAGVHALQNFFHFDTELLLQLKNSNNADSTYHLNAIIGNDIVIKSITQVSETAHCRFDALSREYSYYIYNHKNPFLQQTAYYYPFPLNINLLQQAAQIVAQTTDFTSFSKKHTQVNNFNCKIYKSQWIQNAQTLEYNVSGNRFLRGMVRALVGTMLQVGTQKITLAQFQAIITDKDYSKANFAIPPHGLFLTKVNYNVINI